jgi:hypothetical protein
MSSPLLDAPLSSSQSRCGPLPSSAPGDFFTPSQATFRRRPGNNKSETSLPPLCHCRQAKGPHIAFNCPAQAASSTAWRTSHRPASLTIERTRHYQREPPTSATPLSGSANSSLDLRSRLLLPVHLLRGHLIDGSQLQPLPGANATTSSTPSSLHTYSDSKSMAVTSSLCRRQQVPITEARRYS